MTWLRALIRDRGGTSAVEFALVVMPVMLMLFGVVEFGRLVWTRDAIQQLASETARCMAIVATGCADASTKAYSDAQTRTSLAAQAASRSIATPVATLDRAAVCSGVTGFSQATLRSDFTSAVPGLITALAGTTSLTATACYPNQG